MKKLVASLLVAGIVYSNICERTTAQKNYADMRRALEQIQEPDPIEQLLRDIYHDIPNGHIVDAVKDTQYVYDQGGDPIYGEIKPQALKKIADNLKDARGAPLFNKNTCFYDLGSGLGKTVIQISVDKQVKKAVGIELAPSRHSRAEQAKQKLCQLKEINTSAIEFRNEDIRKAVLDSATIVYMCSTCYPKELMTDIVKKLETIPSLVCIITLKRLPEPDTCFKLISSDTYEMSWSNNVPVYIYLRNQ